MVILSGVCLVVVLVTVCFAFRAGERRLDGNEIRSLRRFSERVKREAAFPFE
jgi:hypothetical protein